MLGLWRYRSTVIAGLVLIPCFHFISGSQHTVDRRGMKRAQEFQGTRQQHEVESHLDIDPAVFMADAQDSGHKNYVEVSSAGELDLWPPVVDGSNSYGSDHNTAKVIRAALPASPTSSSARTSGAPGNATRAASFVASFNSIQLSWQWLVLSVACLIAAGLAGLALMSHFIARMADSTEYQDREEDFQLGGTAEQRRTGGMARDTARRTEAPAAFQG